jgi:hypothetical protein
MISASKGTGGSSRFGIEKFLGRIVAWRSASCQIARGAR